MQNNLYFLPTHDGKGEKKTFFLFEYTHDGIPKSTKINDTDKAASIIKAAIKESTRNIVLDTSTNSGRNLLRRVLPNDETAHRFFLAGLYRTHHEIIEEYWSQWKHLSPEERAKKDKFFTMFFHVSRTLGGIRPMSGLDDLSIHLWNIKDFKVLDREGTGLLLKHPVAWLMTIIAVSTKKYHPDELSEQSAQIEKMIAKITHCCCRLLQDPFPFEDTTNVFNAPHSRLFERWPSGGKQDIPSKIVSYVCRDIEGSKKSEMIKKYQPVLWELLDQSKKFFCTLAGTPETELCFGWLFRQSHDFEYCMLKFLDLLMCIWTEVLIAGHETGSTLTFIDHEIFLKHKSTAILKCCKKVVQGCRNHFK